MRINRKSIQEGGCFNDTNIMGTSTLEVPAGPQVGSRKKIKKEGRDLPASAEKKRPSSRI